MIGCKEIILLSIYAYILFIVLKKDQYMEMIVLTIFVFFLLNNSSLFEGFQDINNIDLSSLSNISSNKVSDEKYEDTLAKDLNMGKYDGLCITTGNKEHWMKSPSDTGLISNDKLYSFLGSQGPLKMTLQDQSNLEGPPIDGEEGSPEKKFMLANNVTSPACCPSTFSTSTGCVCTTQKQRDFVASRGKPGPDRVSNEI